MNNKNTIQSYNKSYYQRNKETIKEANANRYLIKKDETKYCEYCDKYISYYNVQHHWKGKIHTLNEKIKKLEKEK